MPGHSNIGAEMLLEEWELKEVEALKSEDYTELLKSVEVSKGSI